MSEINPTDIDHKRILNAEEAAFYADFPDGEAWNKAVRIGKVAVRPVPGVYGKRKLRYDKHAIDKWLDSITVKQARDHGAELMRRIEDGAV